MQEEEELDRSMHTQEGSGAERGPRTQSNVRPPIWLFSLEVGFCCAGDVLTDTEVSRPSSIKCATGLSPLNKLKSNNKTQVRKSNAHKHTDSIVTKPSSECFVPSKDSNLYILVLHIPPCPDPNLQEPQLDRESLLNIS